MIFNLLQSIKTYWKVSLQDLHGVLRQIKLDVTDQDPFKG
jgi:hypothetical protein